MKTITLYNPILDKGGITVSYINIANSLAENYPDTIFHLLVNETKITGITPKTNIEIINISNYQLIPSIHKINWGKYLSSIGTIFGVFYYLKRYKPQYFVSFQGHFIVLLCKLMSRSSTVLIARENTAIGHSFRMFNSKFYKLRLKVKRFTYNHVNLVVTLTEAAAKYSPNLLSLSETKFTAIQNINSKPILESHTGKKFKKLFSSSNPKIISVSRVSQEKGVDTILKAFSLLIKTHKAELIIVGQGSYVSSGKKLAKALGIYSHCHFIGWVHNPSELISKSDVFVTAPIFEGFGNSIIEAMRSKTPVVSTDAPFGPSEILENGKNGILVPVGDDIKFSSAITFLLDNPSKSKGFATIAHKSLTRFDPKLIAYKWGDILGLNE